MGALCEPHIGDGALRCNLVQRPSTQDLYSVKARPPLTLRIRSHKCLRHKHGVLKHIAEILRWCRWHFCCWYLLPQFIVHKNALLRCISRQKITPTDRSLVEMRACSCCLCNFVFRPISPLPQKQFLQNSFRGPRFLPQNFSVAEKLGTPRCT